MEFEGALILPDFKGFPPREGGTLLIDLVLAALEWCGGI
jgi:hypothetical protein